MSQDPKAQITTQEDFLKTAAHEVDRLASKDEPVSVDPDVAEYMGAFVEDALSAEDALDSIEIVGEVEVHD